MFSWIMFLFFLFLLWNPIHTWKTLHTQGFFGFIGIHEIEKLKKQSILNAFTQDGILQGVFMDKDEAGNQILVPVKQIIQTQKRKWKALTGMTIPVNTFTLFLSQLLQKISGNHINIMGTANTALIQDTQGVTFALFERDLPYELKIDFIRRRVTTGSRKHIPGIQTFSGHSKKRRIDDTQTVIDSIEYDISKKTVTHNVISGDLSRRIRQKTYSAKYIPIVHDFFLIEGDETKLAWVDSPFMLQKQWGKNIHIGLDNHLPTFFHVGTQVFRYDKGIALFHIAHISETRESYNVFTSVYENLHFSADIKNISGTYCCIRLDRKNGSVQIIRNPELKEYNLDFPILYGRNGGANTTNSRDDLSSKEFGKQVILRNIDYETKKINGFIICDKLRIVKRFFFTSLCIENVEGKDIRGLGEPVLIQDGEIPYLLFFVECGVTCQNYLVQWNLLNDEWDYVAMNITMNIGFHSLWISSPFS